MSIDNLKHLPKKVAEQTLVDYAECLTDWYIERYSIEDRKAKGQYFTHKKVSELMVKLFENVGEKDVIRILDPGAGIGIFESTLCEYIKSLGKKINTSFYLYENDVTIIPLLEQNLKICEEDMTARGLEINYKIFNDDFILSNADIFNGRGNFDENKDGYDFVISNPPYYKLKKEAKQVVGMKEIVSGQPNIYTLFMAISAKLLKNGGQMTVLTPRSYCSGLYFKKFRKWFLNIIKPQKIHLFESRKEIFKKYDVLQENVILTAKKTSRSPEYILISLSEGIPNDKLSVKKATYNEIIIEKNNDIIMRIPTSELDDIIAANIDEFDDNLQTLGFKVSTGPVVPFRAKNFLLNKLNGNIGIIPLIWMHNIENGIVKWPIEKNNIPIGLKKTTESKKILKPNKNYVLIKRFSAKEGKQRINAGIYLKKSLKSDYIGIENHVNYLYKKDGELTPDEVYGIAALLNSKLYNRYFQITNGSTQVNASEIRNLPLPSIKIIQDIGDLMQKLKSTDDILKEKIILNFLKIDENISKKLLV